MRYRKEITFSRLPLLLTPTTFAAWPSSGIDLQILDDVKAGKALEIPPDHPDFNTDLTDGMLFDLGFAMRTMEHGDPSIAAAKKYNDKEWTTEIYKAKRYEAKNCKANTCTPQKCKANIRTAGLIYFEKSQSRNNNFRNTKRPKSKGASWWRRIQT